MIEIHELTKRYGDKTALNQLTLTIASGQIFGLLGNNGAGKSTTIKNLVSIIKPTSGTVTVDGLDLEQQRQAVKERSLTCRTHPIFSSTFGDGILGLDSCRLPAIRGNRSATAPTAGGTVRYG